MASKLNSHRAISFDRPDRNNESSFEVIDMDTSFHTRPIDFKPDVVSHNSPFNYKDNSSNNRPAGFPMPLS